MISSPPVCKIISLLVDVDDSARDRMRKAWPSLTFEGPTRVHMLLHPARGKLVMMEGRTVCWRTQRAPFFP